MSYIGKTPTPAPLTSSDIADGIISTAKIANDAATLAKMAQGTDGNLISYDASGNPVAVATGNDGQVLTSTGAGSPPVFEAVAANAGTLDFQSDRSGNLSVSASTNTEIVFNATAINTGSKYNTSTGRYTPAVAGNYFVTASVTFDPASSQSTGQRCYLKIRKNGVDTEYGQVARAGEGNESDFALTTSAVITLDANDYISVWVFSYQVAQVLLSDQASFNGFRLS